MTADLGGRCYQVVAPIGQGGFGTVYRAELLGGGGFSKQVALKMLHRRHKRADAMVRRLRDEANILAMVRHPAIVQVDGLAELQGRWTIIMEYVAGATLKDCIEATGPLPPPAALEIAGVIASALYEAYNTPGPDGRPLRILHRDVKPSNVQVPASGAVKILDFGIARADFERRESNTTSRGFGSWDYVAPERLDGVDSPAGDVYSIGTLLFEALTGEPFGRASGNPVRHQKRLSEGLERLSATAAGQVPEVRDLLEHLLAYDPEDRPASRDVERLAKEARDATKGEALPVWASRTVPMVVERIPRMPLDRLCGTILEDGMEDDDEDEDVGDAPSVAPAFGFPADVTGDLLRSLTGDYPAMPHLPALPSERPPLTLKDLATRDLTPAGTRVGRAWAVASVVLLVLVLIAMGGLVTLALTPTPRTVTIVRPAAPLAAPARSVLDPEPDLEVSLQPDQSVEPDGEGSPPEVAVTQSNPVAPISSPPSPAQPPPGPGPLIVGPRRTMGVVSASGDHVSVTLIGDQGSFPPGRVPAGTYVVEAAFPDRGTVVAGRVTVEAGRRLRLVCNAVFSRCEPR